ncbi:MAG TPA: AlkA N-terminal domain-containing protein [Caulobacteraceae bacterium]|jgi:AraC family transcriptional regulator of adaptative response / DNA-3-methyladenine glycosylase II
MDMDDDACYRALTTRDARFDGRLFVAVKTTRIYCRPICPARTPLRRNVRFYPTAAAAQEAGFRPCLRCRPETSPDLAAWRGTSNTVARALTLIEGGALDDGDVEALADRLGVGERQLRRLFRQHLGASPVAVAQTRRVLLAKQLIQETRLPMAEVAMASGFGSVRRFNETFQQLYARPPASLRRLEGPDRSGESGDAVRVWLPYKPPYDWEAMLAFLSLRAIPGVEAVVGQRYARSIGIGDDQGVLQVEPATKNRIAVSVRFPKIVALPSIISRVRRVFDLSADPAAIGAHLAQDPALAPLVAARPGLRVPGAWDGFELAIRAILGQQITVHAARLLAGKLVAACGAPLPDALAGDGLTHVFPTPERLLAFDFATLGMPRSRANALAAMTQAVAADPAIFGPKRSLDDAVKALKALPGIGEWTAQYIAMRQLREPDAFPAADIGLMRALADAGGKRPTPQELAQRAEAWRPWRAYAALHLWSSETPGLELKETDRDRDAA